MWLSFKNEVKWELSQTMRWLSYYGYQVCQVGKEQEDFAGKSKLFQYYFELELNKLIK